MLVHPFSLILYPAVYLCHNTSASLHGHACQRACKRIWKSSCQKRRWSCPQERFFCTRQYCAYRTIICYSSTCQDSSRQSHYSARWLALDGDTKNKVKHEVLLTLGSASAKIGSVAAQVVSAIAAVELPVNQWHELVEILLGFVNKQDNDNLRIATLQAIGYICEAIVSHFFVRDNSLLQLPLQET